MMSHFRLGDRQFGKYPPMLAASATWRTLPASAKVGFHLPLALTLAALVLGVVVSFSNAVQTQAQEVPEGFKQLLPRGGIPAIDDPQYVAADRAKIQDRAFVFGVVIEGQPVAYSLNLLNSHEVVNDTIGKTNFAAVW